MASTQSLVIFCVNDLNELPSNFQLQPNYLVIYKQKQTNINALQYLAGKFFYPW